MSQATATTTTLPLTMCSNAYFVTSLVMRPPSRSTSISSIGVVLPPPLIPWDTRGVIGLATVLQQLPQSQMPFQAYVDYAMGPL